jgi:MFS family permease
MADNVTLDAGLNEIQVIEEARAATPRYPLANRNFRLLWLGEGISLLGDQFYLIALPLLVFQLTGSELALGTILMVAGIPRAVFMLLGGVLTDRFSPRTLMLFSNLARFFISAILVAFVVTNNTAIWMLYVTAFAFGLVDAFFHPAFMAITPAIVEEKDLEASNATIQGTALITQSVGPAIAGAVVKAVGIPLALIVDAFSFLVATLTLRAMDKDKGGISPTTQSKPGDVFVEIRDMLRFVWSDPILKPVILISTALNFFFAGPMAVGTASLAKARFQQDPVAYGVLLSTLGIGSLIGMGIGGTYKPNRLGLIVLSSLAISGISLGLLGSATTLPVACALAAITGICTGFTNILMISFLQKRIVKEMMGRVMSLLMLASFGLTPISLGLAGVVAEVSVVALFASAGVFITITSVLALADRNMRMLESA